jgi:hypothetical protein
MRVSLTNCVRSNCETKSMTQVANGVIFSSNLHTVYTNRVLCMISLSS